MAAPVVVVAAGAVGVGAPALAVATCPENNHICFYQSFTTESGLHGFSGSMSDQTGALYNNDRLIYISETAKWIWTKGAIERFRNSHYTNKDELDNSVSAIANHSDRCLYLYPTYSWLMNVNPRYGLELGPHSEVFLTGGPHNELSALNETFGSAATFQVGDVHCTAARNTYVISTYELE